ncbi:MAG: hypothetical protein KGD72_00775 [Candidatus Lokiarchaeota archaeon]|nr:hypothetical protein [Candidatus Lokiarchaeota archaeon]
MKKKRSILINNPQLRKIRNNLRLLLMRWASREWNLLNDKETNLSYDEEGRPRHPSTYSEKEKSERIRLSSQMDKNKEIVKNSICVCYRCPATGKNMTYNPIEKAWFCFQCYEEMKQWTAKKKTGISVRFP